MSVSVWPRRNTTVTLTSGFVITAAGAVAELTDEISGLLRTQKLFTLDPTEENPNPSPIAPTETGSGYINLKLSGASAAGAYDTQSYLNDCVSSLPAEGGTIYVPRGEYSFTTNTMPAEIGDYTTLCGEGDASVFRRDNSTTLWFVDLAEGAKGVTIKDMRFAHTNLVQYQTSIRAITPENLTVQNCHFECEGPDPTELAPGPGVPLDQTLHAMLIYNSLGMTVTNNRVIAQQLKLGSSDGGRRTIVTNNHIDRANDFAISFICAYEGTRNVSDFLCSGNMITNGKKSGGIYFGGDSEHYPPGTCKRISITGNVFSGEWPWAVPHSMILGHLGGQTEDVVVANNSMIDERTELSGYGIYLKWIDDAASGKYQSRTIVQGNTAQHFDYGSIELLVGPGNGTLIVDNAVGDSRGIRVFAMGDVDGLTIRGNSAAGCRSTGIHVEARAGNITNLLIEGNTIVDTTTGYATGILLDATTYAISGLVRDNFVSGSTYGITQNRSSGSLNVRYEDNDCSGCAVGFRPTVNFSTVTGVGVGSGNRGSNFPSSAPASGTWAVGDRVQNHSPSAGQPKGWVCTVAGTPGTWVSEGNL